MALFTTKEEIQDRLLSELLEKQYSLVLYDDPNISSELVLECLIKYCGHSIEQSCQCIEIIEGKGKYAVKQGSIKRLTPIYKAFTDHKLTSSIE